MSRSFKLKDKLVTVGDTVSLTYKLKEGEKERQQKIAGVLIKFRGSRNSNKMFTIRKISRSGIGVERIIPLSSPLIVDIKVTKKSKSTRSKIYYIRNLSDQELRHKIYH